MLKLLPFILMFGVFTATACSSATSTSNALLLDDAAPTAVLAAGDSWTSPLPILDVCVLPNGLHVLLLCGNPTGNGAVLVLDHHFNVQSRIDLSKGSPAKMKVGEDSKAVAVAFASGLIEIYSLISLKTIATIEGKSSVVHLHFESIDRDLSVVTSAGKWMSYDSASGAVTRDIDLGNGSIVSAAFSPDCKAVAFSALGDEKLYLRWLDNNTECNLAACERAPVRIEWPVPDTVFVVEQGKVLQTATLGMPQATAIHVEHGDNGICRAKHLWCKSITSSNSAMRFQRVYGTKCVRGENEVTVVFRDGIRTWNLVSSEAKLFIPSNDRRYQNVVWDSAVVVEGGNSIYAVGDRWKLYKLHVSAPSSKSTSK